MASPRQPCNQPFYAFYQVLVEHLALWPPGPFTSGFPYSLFLHYSSLHFSHVLGIHWLLTFPPWSLLQMPSYSGDYQNQVPLKPTLSTSWLTYIHPAIGASPIFHLSSGYFLCAPWLQALLSTWVGGVRWNFWSPKKLPELDREDKMVPTATGCSSQVRWP